MALPALADAAGGDEHVGSGARAEIEDRLALVEVGHGGGTPQPSEASTAALGAASPSSS